MSVREPHMDYERLAREGLPGRTSRPARVVVVGAGMAGLVTTYELLQAGHDPTIVEGRTRVGGRIQTIREPFAPGLYAEAGAMRIPKAHNLTMAYIEKFGVETAPFRMGNPDAYYYFNRTRIRCHEAQANPDLLGFEVAESERGKSASQMFRESLQPIFDKLEAEGDAAWPSIFEQYDQYSTREFLEECGWSEGAIEMYGIVENQESRMNASFVELVIAEIGHAFQDMRQVVGGMDNLPRAFLPALQNRIRFGATMTALEQWEDGVRVHFRTDAGMQSVEGDYAVLTVPFSVMRHIEVLQPFSRAKQRAIRQLHYDASGKIFMQCRRRFWEEDDGISGGGTVTDLAVRNIYYPEHGRETGRGVLLASYTWAEDAQRWGSLAPEDRVSQAIENVALVHPQILTEYEEGASKMWHEDPFACGAFVLFEPGQKTLLHEHIIAPEGRVYFAGEHASLVHRWIQGAVESGLRTAQQIHSISMQ